MLALSRGSGRQAGDSWGFDWGVVDSALFPDLGDELMVADGAVTNHDQDRRTALLDLACGGAGQDLVENSRVELIEVIGGTCIAGR